VHTGLGALLLEGRASLLFLALLVGCLALIQAYSHIPPGLHPPQPPSGILFPAQFLVALAFWILTSWLSLTLTSLQREFSLLRERKTRIDRLRAIGALAAGLSHEFATPLNTAQLKLERLARVHDLADDGDLSTASDALNRCREVLRHMAGAQLRPEGLVLETVDVSALVEQVCTSAAQDRADATIEFSRGGRGSGRAVLPDIAFSQAILNLIDNALEAGNPDGPVQIHVLTHSDRVDVSVFDRGNGWPEVVRRHLGEPFVTTRPDGVGLGLYYVHTLAEALGAELQLEDRQDGGAIARISLPTATTGGSEA
jgi:two-component system sensor histidine kinase RegB